MAKIKIELKLSNAGDAQDQLRTIIALIGRGHMQGTGWAIAEGEPELGTKVPELDDLTDQLFLLVSDEDLDEVKLTEASEGLLPAIYDHLRKAGYGSDEVATEDKAPESSEAGQISTESPEKTPEGAQVEKPEAPQGGAPEGSQEGTTAEIKGNGEGGTRPKFPWEK